MDCGSEMLRLTQRPGTVTMAILVLDMVPLDMAAMDFGSVMLRLTQKPGTATTATLVLDMVPPVMVAMPDTDSGSEMPSLTPRLGTATTDRDIAMAVWDTPLLPAQFTATQILDTLDTELEMVSIELILKQHDQCKPIVHNYAQILIIF